MRVNKVLMTLEGLTDQEADEIQEVIEAIVVKGKIPHPLPPWVDLWFNELGFAGTNQWLVLMSTAFPQRMLLSLLYHYKAKLPR